MDKQQQPPSIEVYDAQEPSEEGKQIAQLFTEMRNKQLDFLDDAGKSMVERITTFLAILFAVTAFSNNFPPAYLKGNLPAKITVIVTLVFYLLAMAMAILTIQPRLYDISRYNVTRMKSELTRITTYKMARLRVAGVLFALGSVALAVLIIFIIWTV